MPELTDYRNALANVIAEGLSVPVVPGMLEGPQTDRDVGSLYCRLVAEVPTRVGEETIISVLRLFKQYDQQVDKSTSFDPTPLETWLDQLQAVIAANNTGLGPWFQRIVSFTIDIPT